jgi:hypothetical protein
VLAFLGRDWDGARRSKDRAVAVHVREHGVDSAFALEQTLLDAVWPRILSGRGDDLKAHLSLRRKLARARSYRR